MFMNEDVTIGAWMLAMDVEHEDNRDICATACGPTSIAVWDLPKCSGTSQGPHFQFVFVLFDCTCLFDVHFCSKSIIEDLHSLLESSNFLTALTIRLPIVVIKSIIASIQCAIL